MRLACIHTHTVFCDGTDDIETCCRRAYEKGLLSLGFSAHAPITKKTGIASDWHLPDERLEEYMETVRLAQKRWEGKLPVYLGLEVDFIDRLMGPADREYGEMDLDFIIGSVHFVVPPRGEPITVDDSAENVDRSIEKYFDGDPMGMVEAYYDTEAAMIRAGGFDVLGHPDVVKKNNSGSRLFSEDDDYYKQKTALIAGLMAGAGIPGEVNTGGLCRGKIKDCYPSSGFLKLFRERGVPMVINADAHRARDLDGHYEEARAAMLAAGFTETVLFEGRTRPAVPGRAVSPSRKNGRPVWRSVRL